MRGLLSIEDTPQDADKRGIHVASVWIAALCECGPPILVTDEEQTNAAREVYVYGASAVDR